MSQELVHKAKQEPRTADPSLECQIVSIEARVDGISVGTGTAWSRTSRNEMFDFNVDLREIGRGDDKLRVRYALSFGRPSVGQASRVRGEALIQFSHLGAQTDLRSQGDYLANQIAVGIFRKNYESIYLLHASMGLDVPSPWIMRDVRIS